MPEERELEKRVLSLETLLDFSRSLNVVVALPELSNLFVLTAMGRFSVVRAALLSAGEGNGARLDPMVCHGFAAADLAALGLSWSDGIPARAAAEGTRVYLEDPEAAPLRALGARIAAPLLCHGRPIGLLLLGDRIRGAPLSAHDEQMLASMSEIAAIAIENSILLESLRRSNAELVEKNTRLREMDRLKSEILQNTGHELRTPLTCVLSYSEFLRDQALDPRRRTEFADLIISQGQKLAIMIDELLDLSALSTGDVKPDFSVLDLNALLDEEMEPFRIASAKKGIMLETRFDPSVGNVVVDGGMIRRIVRCLVDNAVKFTPAGGRVRLSSARDDSGIVVRVTDTGIGIAPEHHALVFDRFRQVDGSTTRTYGGLGIGLSLAKELAELHGGRITLSSAPGKGSEFTLVIPQGAPGPA